MLPSMPILYTRDSQDAFGNKIVPGTSFLNQNLQTKSVVQSEASLLKIITTKPNEKENEAHNKDNIKKKEELTKSKSDDNYYKETALARSFYTKIQTRFASHATAPTNKFAQFKAILKTFNPATDTPVDLYKKVEQLFGNEHQDLLEEFLLFLKPSQATAVGRFMDHMMLAQMTMFIELLQNTFSRKPTVLRKVMRAITTSINSRNSTCVKSRVLPHLRLHPRLTQMFKSLFPDERPPDSIYDVGTDVLQDSILECDKGYDVWEFEDKDNTKKGDAKVLNSEYLHGRVFLQHGRLLRTACVTYPYSKEPYRSHARRLAPNHCLSPAESDSERASPKRNKSASKIPQKRTRKQLKSPTKSVKDVNDNTKKDCLIHALNSTKVKGKTHQKSKQKKDEIPHKKKENVIKGCLKRDCETKSKTNKLEIDLKLRQIQVEVPKVETRSWTRDEDKTMLEVLKGEPASEQVFIRIRELLPHRTTREIKERFCHVMNLLQQMAVNEVT